MNKSKAFSATNVKSLRSLPRERVPGGLILRFLPVPRAPYNITLLHELLPPFSETPALYHRRTAEFVFIIKGSGTVYLDGRRTRIKAGDMFGIPAGMQHQFATRQSSVEALSLFAPPLDLKKPDVCPGTDARTGSRFAEDAVRLKKSGSSRRSRGRR